MDERYNKCEFCEDTGVVRMEEGKMKRGGVKPPPVTPKPNIKPSADKPIKPPPAPIILTKEDYDKVIRLLNSNPEPNENLIKAFKEYKLKVWSKEE